MNRDLELSNLKIENNRLEDLVDQYEQQERIHVRIHLAMTIMAAITTTLAILVALA
ncbi:hypothetical protein [Terrihalobacillus insolitus]|uniref:hypothetical protein n=1 Tax=Terrihalobacillus insolitus TaxID=2950438 RepID=UPI002341A931|nr:hypothetical protein [Terrihalobacillus insolitus]MDC3414290.1 hypothetical protein [Terrihalobacillus insolitus]